MTRPLASWFLPCLRASAERRPSIAFPGRTRWRTTEVDPHNARHRMRTGSVVTRGGTLLLSDGVDRPSTARDATCCCRSRHGNQSTMEARCRICPVTLRHTDCSTKRHAVRRNASSTAVNYTTTPIRHSNIHCTARK